MDIDYIFPWVNPNDEHWRRLFYKYRRPDDLFDCRFRDFGLLKYVFRGIAANMPWINKVHIILAQDTQLPPWLNTDHVNVIYHSDYIPKEFLPTYNSHTIESYLGNIQGLSEYLIYGNDDVYPVSPSNPEDWFSSDGKPKIRYMVSNEAPGTFKQFCKKNFDDISDALRINHDDGYYMRPSHYSTPLTLTAIRETFNILKDHIKTGITRFRNFNTNYSFYVFVDYILLKKQNEPVSDKDTFGKCMTMLNNTEAREIANFVKTTTTRVLCINDTEKTDMSNIQVLVKAFQEKFPNKCKYER